MRMLVLGSGRMGLDAARLGLAAGWEVTVVSRDPARLAACLGRLRREVRRLRNTGRSVVDPEGLLPGMEPGGPFDLVFETVEEDLRAKREAIGRWKPFLGCHGLLVTNTSSLIPWEIHPEALGLHLFHPAALMGFCEVILPMGHSPEVSERLEKVVADLGLRPIVEVGVRRAHAINRLFLPSQAWAVHQVRKGRDPQEVDDAFGRAWPGLRPLLLMDSVGPDTIGRALDVFRSRMDPEEARSYGELAVGIADRIRRGSWCSEVDVSGRRIGASSSEKAWAEELSRDAEALFLRVGHATIESGLLQERDLQVVLEGLFGASWPPRDPAEGDWRGRCERRWRETGLPWWRPSEGPPIGDAEWAGRQGIDRPGRVS